MSLFAIEFLNKKYTFSLTKRKIARQLNRDQIGKDKLKQSLREAIAFTSIKIGELMHNYVSYFINDKQLYVVLDFVEQVNLLSLLKEIIFL